MPYLSLCNAESCGPFIPSDRAAYNVTAPVGVDVSIGGVAGTRLQVRCAGGYEPSSLSLEASHVEAVMCVEGRWLNFEMECVGA